MPSEPPQRTPEKRAPRIFTDQPLAANASVELEAGSARHVGRVLRMQAGDPLVLFNGAGGQYRATISTADRKSVVVDTGEFDPVERESALPIELGIAISRGERMDWVVQKATELGVRAIAPLFSERTEVRLRGEREERKLQHWQQIATSACEQCGRNRLPLLHAPQSLGLWLDSIDADCRLVLDHRAGQGLQPGQRPARVALLVGPEGGLSATEIEAAQRAGFHGLQLGPRVLRTETAPLAALAILQARWGDMGDQPPD
jgi:16S rRNA (uracil1498-N3)-methyltransferase